jgi:transposase-like protein
MERRQYDWEFKIDAVKLSMQEGKKVTEVAAGLGRQLKDAEQERKYCIP